MLIIDAAMLIIDAATSSVLPLDHGTVLDHHRIFFVHMPFLQDEKQSNVKNGRINVRAFEPDGCMTTKSIVFALKKSPLRETREKWNATRTREGFSAGSTHRVQLVF